MKFDITSFPARPETGAEQAQWAEAAGFDGYWTAEAAHNPFFPLTLAASATERITLGTQIAVAFPRSPMVTAQIAWDLAAQSDGRFVLGLGTQVRAHIERRFGITWDKPLARLREYIEGMRAIWDTFQTDARMRYKGEYYTFRLMAPFFNPGPIKHPRIPVYIAGVNRGICRLAGELCDGLHAHGFHTAQYLRDVVQVSVSSGLEASGRRREDFELVVPVFTVTGENDEQMARMAAEVKGRIAFYASTPGYSVVLEQHGWQEVGQKLGRMAREGRWDEMWREISDEMLETVAVVAPPDQLGARIRERYAGLADRICFGWEDDGPANRELWQHIMRSVRG